MPDRAVGAGEVADIVAGKRAFLDEQLAHRHHFPFDLLALGAEIIVLAGLRIGIDLGDLKVAALPPAHRQVLVVGLPVVFQRRHHPRGRAVEARGDVLLAVGDEIRLGSLGVDGDVHAETKAGSLGDVLHELHLRAVKAHAVDVGPFGPGFRCWSGCRRSGEFLPPWVLLTNSKPCTGSALGNAQRWCEIGL